MLTSITQTTVESAELRKKAAKITVVHYWGGQPQVRTSRFDWHHAILDGCNRKGRRSVIVFSSVPENEEIRNALKQSNIECFYIARPKKQFDIKCIRDSYRLFKNLRCTIAHFHCVHTSPIIGAVLAGVPIRIWSNHSSDYRDDGRSLGWIHRFGISTRVTCALAHKILPISESIHKELLRYGISDARMSVAPIPINVSRYAARPDTRACVRKSLGCEEQELLICTVGRAVYLKGWDILIQAFAQAIQQVPQMRLLLVGAIGTMGAGEPDEYQKRLMELIDNLKIQDRVHFLGIRKDIGDILSACDLFVFPSRAEGLGLALLEAMAAGLPCIASSAGGIPEILQDGKNGLLVPSEDVDALTAALTRLATDQALSMRLSKNTPLSLEVFSLDYQTNNILELYDDLLAERGLTSVKNANGR